MPKRRRTRFGRQLRKTRRASALLSAVAAFAQLAAQKKSRKSFATHSLPSAPRWTRTNNLLIKRQPQAVFGIWYDCVSVFAVAVMTSFRDRNGLRFKTV